MSPTPLYLSIGFMATVLLTLFFLRKASKVSKPLFISVAVWLLVQGIISATGFYTDTTSLPPRMIVILLPPLLTILVLFASAKGRAFIDRFDMVWLNWLHVVRIPVELSLLLLFKEALVPELMTFEGINFDIFSGLSAPLIVYFGYRKKQWGKTILLTWNFICLALLFNIVYHGILSVPTPFQRFGFEQPNTGLTYFPFIFLPGFIVPAVLFAHLVSIRQLLRK